MAGNERRDARGNRRSAVECRRHRSLRHVGKDARIDAPSRDALAADRSLTRPLPRAASKVARGPARTDPPPSGVSASASASAEGPLEVCEVARRGPQSRLHGVGRPQADPPQRPLYQRCARETLRVHVDTCVETAAVQRNYACL